MFRLPFLPKQATPKPELGPIESKMAVRVKLLTLKGIVPKRIVMGPGFHARLCSEMGRDPEHTRLKMWLDIPIEVTNECGHDKIGFFSGPLN